MGLFGPEKIVLTLEKYAYKPGDVIKGTVKLQLKKTMNARKFEVGLIGRKIVHTHSSVHSGPSHGRHHHTGQHQQTQHITIYDFQIPLGGEQEYLQGIFPFEIPIPATLPQEKPPQEGTGSTVVNILKSLQAGSSYVEWLVVARLDLPLKIDVSASQKIVIS